MDSVDIKSKFAEAKGRNGWFVPKRIEVWYMHTRPYVCLDVVSKRLGKATPITLSIGVDEAETLGKQLLTAVFESRCRF